MVKKPKWQNTQNIKIPQMTKYTKHQNTKKYLNIQNIEIHQSRKTPNFKMLKTTKYLKIEIPELSKYPKHWNTPNTEIPPTSKHPQSKKTSKHPKYLNTQNVEICITSKYIKGQNTQNLEMAQTKKNKCQNTPNIKTQQK